MAKLIFLLFICAFVVTYCDARTFSRCGLVRELRKYGFPKNKLRDWVCLVEHESARNTARVGGPNTDGSHDYGLFQINDRYWCSNTNTPGKECHVTCADLLKNNISKAVKCAKKIYKRHKFNAWYGWLNYCRTPGALPDISKC